MSRREGPKYPYRAAIWQGYKRGNAAKWLAGEDYEALMAEPLEAARKRLNITPATIYDAIPQDARDGASPKV
jgi:ubiquinone biosynthesis protein COQ4